MYAVYVVQLNVEVPNMTPCFINKRECEKCPDFLDYNAEPVFFSLQLFGFSLMVWFP